MSSTGKVAVITGAGSGVGKQVAIALAADGYGLVLAGRRAEPLEAVAREAQALGARAVPVAADVGDPAAVKDLFAKVREAVRATRPALQQCRYRRARRSRWKI